MSDEHEVPRATPAPPGALCALHPTSAAEGICARCGNYMCAYCSDRGTSTECLACRERAGASNFPFDRGSFRVFALLDYAWQMFRHYWVKLTLVSAAMLISSEGIALVGSFGPGMRGEAGSSPVSLVLHGFALVLQTVVGIAGGLAQYRWCLRAVEAQPLEVDDLFRAMRRLPQALLMVAIVVAPVLGVAALGGFGFGFWKAMGGGRSPVTDLHSIGVLLGLAGVLLLAFIVAVVYVALGVMFATLALVHDDSVGAWDAIKQSWEMASGRRWRLLGATVILGLVVFAGLLFCFVGVFPAAAYATLALTCMYNALRKKETSR